MNKNKKPIVMITFLVACVLLGITVYRWIRYDIIDGGSIFFSFIAISYFINALNWGDLEGGSGKDDELAQHIKTQSARIGYYVLMVLSALVLFISEGVSNLNDIQNYPLIIVVGLTFIVSPIVELFYSKKFK
ncbi:hypothetical protein [Bacillus horti]|uniref:DUF2178 domain-containing protein n=2 Tax=Caldalkalibacillus horti TaxID=77523 RepID=A0ABT9VYY9_9BACI|nr:hypothetical protein [Bacillus horti]MDQ0166209.1 hypothetical protein [Bacillus horti]